MTDWSSLYAGRMQGVVASDIRERMKLLGAREIIHLGGGLPDPAVFPCDRLAAASARLWADPARARAALQYAPSEGYAPLRAWIAGHMTRQGAPCTPDNILVTNGSQQALDFAAKLFLSPGDPALVEAPCFIGALRAFDAYQPRYVALPADPAEWRAERLQAKFAYVGPDFRNPTGTTMTLAERHALLDLAAETGMAIVEDGCYQALRYDGEPIPSLLALAVARHGDVERIPVLHAGTFSKVVAPALRIGWVAGPAEVIRKLTLIKQASDLATSTLTQMLLLDVLDDLDEMVARSIAVYRARRDAMLAALAETMPEGVRWTRPEGGLYIWLTLPDQIDAARLAERALIERSVSVISGAPFYPAGVPNDGRSCIRLSFSMIPADRARIGVERLAALLREDLA